MKISIIQVPQLSRSSQYAEGIALHSRQRCSSQQTFRQVCFEGVLDEAPAISTAELHMS